LIKVLEYEWVDHHAPPLKLLFVICNEIHNFLKESDENVVAINCRAGKGRTGTVICCYLLFSRRFEDPEEVLQYYSKKRFNLGEGVTQPSQKRYVYYFAQLLKEKIYFPLVRSIKAISINKFVSKNSDSLKPYFEIYLGNSDKIFYTNKTSYLDQKKIFSNNTDLITITDTSFALVASGDLTIKLYNNGMISAKKLGRISFNTAFLAPDQTTLVFKITEIDPDNLAKNKKIPKDFEIRVKFGILCDCYNRELPINLCSSCCDILANELSDWKEINLVLEVMIRKK
jgi:phosphatidylinositol-3,4,5-trisphosphate 3-phosphatase and dual-specificity protein phosphatase PTEN